MERCDKCNQEIKPAQTDRVFVKVDAQAFRDLCATLLRNPSCTDPKFREALGDLPNSVDRFGQLTEGQAKFFKVIHNKVTGTWPELTKLGVKAEEPKRHELPDDLDDIPF